MYQKIDDSKPYKNGNVVVGGPKSPLYGDAEPFRYEDNDGMILNTYSLTKIEEANIGVPASTETAYALPDGTKKIEFQNRQATDVYFSFFPGKVAGPTEPYFTLKANDAYYQEYDGLYNETIYFGAASSGTVELRVFK